MISLNQALSQQKQKRNTQGFTIVELLIVIVVIAILALLVITTYSGIQAKARDAKRKSDVSAIQTQVEAYYANNNDHYPNMADINDSAWRTTNNFKIDTEALKDPQGATAALVAAAGSKVYAYAAAGGANCLAAINADTTCATYTLTATLEAGGTFVKTQLN